MIDSSAINIDIRVDVGARFERKITFPFSITGYTFSGGIIDKATGNAFATMLFTNVSQYIIVAYFTQAATATLVNASDELTWYIDVTDGSGFVSRMFYGSVTKRIKERGGE